MARRTAALLTLLAAGCLSKIEEDLKPSGKSILHKTTQEIGRFDPNDAGVIVSDGKVEYKDPVLGPMDAYGGLVEQTAQLAIQGHLNTFYALHGRYPTYDQFMSEIIKENNIQLPVLPGGAKYQYDEKNHRLVVVKPRPKEGEAGGP